MRLSKNGCLLITRGKNSQSRNTDELPRFRNWRLLGRVPTSCLIFPVYLKSMPISGLLGAAAGAAAAGEIILFPSAKRLSANGLPIATEKPTKIALETMPCATPKFSR